MNILVTGSQILMVGPIERADTWETADQVLPKSVAPKAKVVSAKLPDDFTVSGYLWVNGAVRRAPDAPEALADAKATQSQLVNISAQLALSNVTAGYPELEIATWPQQYAEAQAYKRDPASNTPMLDAIAKSSGWKVEELVSNVLEKGAAYQATSGEAVGRRITAQTKIEAATTIADVQAIAF